MFAMLVEHFDSIPSNKILMIFILLTSNEVYNNLKQATKIVSMNKK